jgi:Bacteriophage HK97-gp10, putative tail-component
MSFRPITTLDTSRFDKRVEQTIAKLRHSLESAGRDAGRAGLDQARRGGFQDRTGELRGTLRWNIVGWTGERFVISITAPKHYASFVELGTQPHEIWPKAAYGASKSSLRGGQSRRGRGSGPHEHVVGRGYALRWVDASGEHFAKMVHHPGSRPIRFMFPAQIQATETYRESLRNGFVGLASIWS